MSPARGPSSRAGARLALGGALGLTLAGAACAHPHVDTIVRIEDPARVALLATDGGVVLAEGSAEASAKLAEGRADAPAGGTTSYEVTALRERDGQLAVEWKTPLGLANGERQRLFTSERELRLDGHAADLFPDGFFDLPRFELGACTRITALRSSGRYGGGFAGNAVRPLDCVGRSPLLATRDGSVGYVLATPWTNVSIVERTRYERDAAWLGIGLATAIFGTAGVAVSAASTSAFKGDGGKQAFLAGLCFGTMLAFDLSLLPLAFSRDRDVRIGHGDKPPAP